MMDAPIPYIPLMMAHDDVSSAPDLCLPSGYSIRLSMPGDEGEWAAIAANASEFASQGEALAYFLRHFRGYIDKLPLRCLMLEDGVGRAVGTATGWFMDDDESIGRLHWVVIAKEHQGRGLCRPLVAQTMRRMAALGHTKAMLTTQPQSWKGIRVYSYLGWKPFDDGSPEFCKGWELVRELTDLQL